MLSLLAHAGHGEHGLAAGLLHPIAGADHLVAAVAVGILASLRLAGEPARRAGAIDRRAASPAKHFALPIAFLIGMTLGGILASLGIALPGVEVGIALSLVAVGVALTLGRPGPTSVSVGVLALLAVFHGHAHLAEYDASSGLAGYAVGLLVATGLLHVAGVAIASVVARPKLPELTFARTAGAATLVFGLSKFAGLA